MPTPEPAPDLSAPPAPWPHVLVVDDDPALRSLLQDYLGANELRITTVVDGRQMAEAFERDAFDLVLMDRRLPGEDGLHLARQLRERAPALPIILLTGKAEEADRVMGLELGADDYVTKPFSNRELLARIRAALRRTQALQAARDSASGGEPGCRAYRFAGWELNLRTRRLGAPDGRRLELGNQEFALLAAFCAAPGRVLSRDQLLGLSRLHQAEVYDRAVDVQVLRLRRKIEPDPFHPRIIVTERGAGYRLDAAVETLY